MKTPRRRGNHKGRIPNGREIRRLRIDRGLTVTEFAQAIGLKPNTVSKIELYNMPASEVRFSKMARALGLVAPDGSAMVGKLLAGSDEDDEPELAAAG